MAYREIARPFVDREAAPGQERWDREHCQAHRALLGPVSVGRGQRLGCLGRHGFTVALEHPRSGLGHQELGRAVRADVPFTELVGHQALLAGIIVVTIIPNEGQPEVGDPAEAAAAAKLVADAAATAGRPYLRPVTGSYHSLLASAAGRP